MDTQKVQMQNSLRKRKSAINLNVVNQWKKAGFFHFKSLQ